MRLEFFLPDRTINLNVRLLDNPGVEAWADKFLNRYQTKAVFHYHTHPWTLDWSIIRESYKQIDQSLRKLRRAGIEYTGIGLVNFGLADSDNIHSWLNSLHRFFTHKQKLCNDRMLGDDIDYLDVSLTLDQINQSVHQIEIFLPVGPKDMPLTEIPEIKLYHPSESDTPAWLNLENYRQYHSADFYDVILTSEILGKTILQNYLDLDNPNNWDTSGHYCSAGGLQICITNTRQQIYQSDSFLSWLAKHNVDPATVYYDFPIGNIKNKESSEFQELVNCLKISDSGIKVIYHRQ
jgi:hypothetical protein